MKPTPAKKSVFARVSAAAGADVRVGGVEAELEEDLADGLEDPAVGGRDALGDGGVRAGPLADRALERPVVGVGELADHAAQALARLDGLELGEGRAAGVARLAPALGDRGEEALEVGEVP